MINSQILNLILIIIYQNNSISEISNNTEIYIHYKISLFHLDYFPIYNIYKTWNFA